MSFCEDGERTHAREILDPVAERERAGVLLFEHAHQLLDASGHDMFVALERDRPKSSRPCAPPSRVFLDVLNANEGDVGFSHCRSDVCYDEQKDGVSYNSAQSDGGRKHALGPFGIPPGPSTRSTKVASRIERWLGPDGDPAGARENKRMLELSLKTIGKLTYPDNVSVCIVQQLEVPHLFATDHMERVQENR